MSSKSVHMIRRSAIPLIIIAAVAVALAVPSSRHALFGFFNLGEEPIESGVYYTCPMHPDIRLPQMTDCPICGMSLVEKTAGEGEDERTGSIAVTPRQIQLSGVNVTPVKKRQLSRDIDTYGVIDYDETHLAVVSAWVGGRIDKLYIDFTGVRVHKGHALAYLYSPDLISAEKEYLLALDNLERIERSSSSAGVAQARELVSAARQRLLRWGLNDAQVEALAKNKKIEDHATLYAPLGGTVIEKKAFEGMYVREGDELFRIADLSRVWLYADIYEEDIPFLYQKRAGDFYECPMHPEVTAQAPAACTKCGMDLIRTNKSMQVEITTRATPGETYLGAISFTDPFLDSETRTVRVRINIDNPERQLKPGMYARVRIHLPLGEMLAVPENAVIDSGQRSIVIVDEGGGKFRPQPVRLGRRWVDDRAGRRHEESAFVFQKESLRYHEVLAGLVEGDRVVTSGNFLLGSESQLQGALAKMIAEDSTGAMSADSREQLEQDSRERHGYNEHRH
jgi:Cu(I)/Ag(I) efflux system membrane fusion protein